jgi:hypothetical protein
LVSIKITEKGVNAVIRKLEHLEQATPTMITHVLIDAATEFIETIRILAPNRTGNYANSWVIGGSPSPTSIEVKTPHGKLAKILEDGVPHAWRINVRRAISLSWIGKDGKRAFAKFVIHPPMPPLKHISPTVRSVAEQMQNIITNNWAKILEIRP